MGQSVPQPTARTAPGHLRNGWATQAWSYFICDTEGAPHRQESGADVEYPTLDDDPAETFRTLFADHPATELD